MIQETPRELVFLRPQSNEERSKSSRTRVQSFNAFSSSQRQSSTDLVHTNVTEAGECPEINSEKEEPSTALHLFDDTWAWRNPRKRARHQDSEIPYRPRNTLSQEARNIARMRTLSRKVWEEDFRKGVSTELTLFLDPWTIKKQITVSDFRHLSLLGAKALLVRIHIIRYLRDEDVRRVNGSMGLVVNVFDHDTGSMHPLVLKKMCSCGSYVLTTEWSTNFVARRGLNPLDEVGFFWDRFTSKLNFRVLSRAPVDLQLRLRAIS